MHRRPTSVTQNPQENVNALLSNPSKYDVVWIEIDDVRVPCVVRNGRPHAPVRILEYTLLNRLSSAAVNAAFQNRRPLVSQYFTEFEALLLSSAVGSHFSVEDLAVDAEEFRELYVHIKSELQRKSTTARPKTAVTGGWLQVNNSVIPFIRVNDTKLLPLSVLTNAAGLMCEPRLVHHCRLCSPTASHCVYLNKLCSSAGLDFTFDTTTTLLVNLADVCTVTKPTPYTRELPSHDPFSHAQYIDERTLSAGSTSSSSPSGVQSWHTANSYTAPEAPITSTSGSVDMHAARPQTATNPLPPVQPPQTNTMPQLVAGSVVSVVDSQPSSSRTVIEPVSFRGRTVSSLRRPGDNNRYVLLDAVCRVFFPDQRNVDGFVRAARTLFHIPDISMTDEEEQQFISYYRLPIYRLLSNKLINLQVLRDIFPRLETLFTGGGADRQVIGTLIPRPPSDPVPPATTAQTTTTATSNDNNGNGDVDRPRKRRRNNVCTEVVVID